MTPNAVTWAVLGLVASKPLTGYDIKRTVDRTIRHFWAASYGQIYPELKRLEEAGWITGDDVPNGGRARRVFSITDAGRDALNGWFGGTETRIELRDESLLRLFFADLLPPDTHSGCSRDAARATGRCSSTCAASTTAAACRTRRTSTSSTGGGSSTANGGSNGATDI